MSERPRVARLLICIVLGAASGGYAYLFATVSRTWKQDLAQVWFAARMILANRNPYDLIGPGLEFSWPAPFFYPLPAAVAATPLAPLPEPIAMAVFAAAAGGLFAWALTQHGYAPLLAFASPCVWQAFEVVQWSPLFAAATVILPLSVLLVAKPTIGFAIFAARPSRWAIGGGVVLAVIAFAVQPTWVEDWRRALGSQSYVAGVGFPYMVPATLPGGVLVLTVLLRWRRSEARLLAALVCVPQTLLPYEAVLLYLVPRGWLQCATMMWLTYAMWSTMHRSAHPDIVVNLAGYISESGRAIVLFLYLPAALMVILRRNEGPIPAWLEERLGRLPSWLRGVPTHT